MQKENHKRGKRGQKDENKSRLSDDVFIFSWFAQTLLKNDRMLPCLGSLFPPFLFPALLPGLDGAPFPAAGDFLVRGALNERDKINSAVTRYTLKFYHQILNGN
jgi:hypothetical protein